MHRPVSELHAGAGQHVHAKSDILRHLVDEIYHSVDRTAIADMAARIVAQVKFFLHTHTHTHTPRVVQTNGLTVFTPPRSFPIR